MPPSIAATRMSGVGSAGESAPLADAQSAKTAKANAQSATNPGAAAPRARSLFSLLFRLTVERLPGASFARKPARRQCAATAFPRPPRARLRGAKAQWNHRRGIRSRNSERSICYGARAAARRYSSRSGGAARLQAAWRGNCRSDRGHVFTPGWSSFRVEASWPDGIPPTLKGPSLFGEARWLDTNCLDGQEWERG